MKKEINLPAPLFRDPIYDCPTDPTVIWNREEEMWYMFYTQRRANDVSIGSSWVHGTDIGIAVSKDGAKWLYRGVLEGLAIERGHNTFWAPEIIWAEGCYHMYVSYITGVPTDWEYPRWLLHYTSANLWDWTFAGRLNLDSERVIDACIYEIEPHLYKMWFKDEDKNSHTYVAISRDLYNWEPMGAEITDCSQEGPNVFELGGIKWMISDFWSGLAVYRSDDFKNWTRCSNILTESGERPMDKGLGHHADVVVRGDRAYIFYFCHPFARERRKMTEEELAAYMSLPACERNKAVVQVAELVVRDGELYCDRNAQVSWPEM